jgi:hypothetical protein
MCEPLNFHRATIVFFAACSMTVIDSMIADYQADPPVI